MIQSLPSGSSQTVSNHLTTDTSLRPVEDPATAVMIEHFLSMKAQRVRSGDWCRYSRSNSSKSLTLPAAL